MVEFIIGFVIAGSIGVYKWRQKEREFRWTLIAIHDGKAEPDENGNVGWLRGL